MVYGSVLGSYAVESFSVRRLVDLPLTDVEKRMLEFREITSFETHVATGAS